MVREEKVRELMDVCSNAMIVAIGDGNVNEVVSTYLTLARAALIAARTMGADPTALQASVAQLYLDCVGETSTETKH